jgi:hypothetical protein
MFVPVTLRQALVEPLAQILRLVPMLPHQVTGLEGFSELLVQLKYAASVRPIT